MTDPTPRPAADSGASGAGDPVRPATPPIEKGLLFQKYIARFADTEREVEVAFDGATWLTRTESGARVLDWHDLGDGRALVFVDGRPVEVRTLPLAEGAVRVELAGRQTVLRIEDDLARRARRSHEQGGGPVPLRSPMPGTLIRFFVKEGEQVVLEQPVAIVEAMKMQNELAAPLAGKIVRIAVKAGEAVDGDQVLLEIEP